MEFVDLAEGKKVTVYCVSYDLRDSGQDYCSLTDYLESLDSCRGTESIWFVDSDLSAEELFRNVRRHTRSEDRLLVGELKQQWCATAHFQCGHWLKAFRRNWG